MSTLRQQTYVTPDEYLATERETEEKNEYVDGMVCAMTGASLRHVRIVTNLSFALESQLRSGPCLVLSSEIKVRSRDSQKFFYPDVAVVCDRPQYHDERTDTILNPVLVVEVLSKSTEAFDRGGKFFAYQQLESLQEYLLVAQDRAAVEQYVRQSDGSWNYRAAVGLESSLVLPSVECTLDLSAVYNKVEWDQTQ